MLGFCVSCGQSFNKDNTFTEAGWRETKISGLCEECFDFFTLTDVDAVVKRMSDEDKEEYLKNILEKDEEM